MSVKKKKGWVVKSASELREYILGNCDALRETRKSLEDSGASPAYNVLSTEPAYIAITHFAVGGNVESIETWKQFQHSRKAVAARQNQLINSAICRTVNRRRDLVRQPKPEFVANITPTLTRMKGTHSCNCFKARKEKEIVRKVEEALETLSTFRASLLEKKIGQLIETFCKKSRQKKNMKFSERKLNSTTLQSPVMAPAESELEYVKYEFLDESLNLKSRQKKNVKFSERKLNSMALQSPAMAPVESEPVYVKYEFLDESLNLNET